MHAYVPYLKASMFYTLMQVLMNVPAVPVRMVVHATLLQLPTAVFVRRVMQALNVKAVSAIKLFHVNA